MASTKFAVNCPFVDHTFDYDMRERLITWGFRLGFALVGLLTLYILILGS